METKSFSRFIPLLLFLVQKKESTVPAKLCVMVSISGKLLCAISLIPPMQTKSCRLLQPLIISTDLQ